MAPIRKSILRAVYLSVGFMLILSVLSYMPYQLSPSYRIGSTLFSGGVGNGATEFFYRRIPTCGVTYK